jgi:hypothetical protein
MSNKGKGKRTSSEAKATDKGKEKVDDGNKKVKVMRDGCKLKTGNGSSNDISVPNINIYDEDAIQELHDRIVFRKVDSMYTIFDPSLDWLVKVYNPTIFKKKKIQRDVKTKKRVLTVHRKYQSPTQVFTFGFT